MDAVIPADAPARHRSWWNREIISTDAEIAHLPAAERKRLGAAAKKQLRRRPVAWLMIAGMWLLWFAWIAVLVIPSWKWLLFSPLYVIFLWIAALDVWCLEAVS
jgi:hypothetical protein